MSDELINKYRPTSFDKVVGQKQICKSIESALEKNTGRSFLLSGVSGIGKTTIGRIIANMVDCPSFNIMEVDGASKTGIDDMRELLDHLQYTSSEPRVIIVDECHALSQQAIKALLKPLEEPPANVYWILCTTELKKVPKEIQTRCLAYVLQPVSRSTIQKLVAKVAKKEKLPIRKDEGALFAVAELAQGSPRQALSLLAQCGDLTDEESVRELCDVEVTASKEAIDLARMLMKGGDWKKFCKCIKDMDASPETVRIIILRYMASVVLGGKKNEKVLAIMDEFSEPFLDREGKAPIILAVARIMF